MKARSFDSPAAEIAHYFELIANLRHSLRDVKPAARGMSKNIIDASTRIRKHCHPTFPLGLRTSVEIKLALNRRNSSRLARELTAACVLVENKKKKTWGAI